MRQGEVYIGKPPRRLVLSRETVRVSMNFTQIVISNPEPEGRLATGMGLFVKDWMQGFIKNENVHV